LQHGQELDFRFGSRRETEDRRSLLTNQWLFVGPGLNNPLNRCHFGTQLSHGTCCGQADLKRDFARGGLECSLLKNAGVRLISERSQGLARQQSQFSLLFGSEDPRSNRLQRIGIAQLGGGHREAELHNSPLGLWGSWCKWDGRSFSQQADVLLGAKCSKEHGGIGSVLWSLGKCGLSQRGPVYLPVQMGQRCGSGGTDGQGLVDSESLQHRQVRLIPSMSDHNNGDEPHPTVGISKRNGKHSVGQGRIKLCGLNRMGNKDHRMGVGVRGHYYGTRASDDEDSVEHLWYKLSFHLYDQYGEILEARGVGWIVLSRDGQALQRQLRGCLDTYMRGVLAHTALPEHVRESELE